MPIEIQLLSGGIAIVSDEDANLATCRWFQNSQGYAVSAEPRRRMIPLHRAVMAHATGCEILPYWQRVDHTDGDALNCRRENLRLATHIAP